MKELLNGLITLIMAILVTVLMWTLGVLFSLIYSIWLTVTLKKFSAFFIFWWRLIDGFAASIGHILFESAVGLDMSWNVNGEIIEDIVTAKEDTMFSEKNITVSATVGKLELSGDLNKFGIKFSRFLNFVFNQKSHAVDAFHYYEAKIKLDKIYFKKRK